MKSIHRLRSRGHLTETQALTALRFWRSPNTFRLAPTLFRILREIVIDEVPIEEIEARRGWPARSAKAILAVILHAMEETDGLFWGEGAQDDARAILEYLHDLDGEELAELCELARDEARKVDHDRLERIERDIHDMRNLIFAAFQRRNSG